MRCVRSSPTWCAVHSASPRDRGSATAEWALALPAVVLVLTAVLASIGTVIAQARIDNAAAEAARLASLGHDGSHVSRHTATLLESFPGVTTTLSDRGPSICAAVTTQHTPRPFPLGPLVLEAEACALDEAGP